MEVKVYFFANDLFEKAEYQYLKVGEDYSGKGESYLDLEYYDPNTWTGKEAQLSLVGLYSDANFENLIDPNIIECVPKDLERIYVRAVSDMYAYRYINNGTYTNGEHTFIVSDNIVSIEVDGVNYKITSINDIGNSNLYVNDILVEDRTRFNFDCSSIGMTYVYKRFFFSLYLDGKHVVPLESNYYSTTAYSIFAYL